MEKIHTSHVTDPAYTKSAKLWNLSA